MQITLRDDDGPTFSSPNDVLMSGGDGDNTLSGQDLLAGDEEVDTHNDATAAIDEAFVLPASALAALDVTG